MVQIAKAVCCSQATVSFVLNDVPQVKISPDLRARVLSTAQSMGYGKGNPLRRVSMEMIPGVCIGVIMDQFAPMPSAFAAGERGFYGLCDGDVTILAAHTQGRPEQERNALARLIRAGAQGIVYESFATRRVSPEPFFDDLRVPVVLANCYTSDGRFPSIVPNEIGGARMATVKLLGLGHRRIATITGRPGDEAVQERFVGYRQALSEAGIDFDGLLVVAGDGTPTSGREAARRLLSLEDKPTAVFCHSAQTAAVFFDAVAEAGLRIPDDISVIGYDDDMLSAHMRPQLTALELPRWSMSAWAVDRASASSSATPGPHDIKKFEYSLIERASCQKR